MISRKKNLSFTKDFQRQKKPPPKAFGFGRGLFLSDLKKDERSNMKDQIWKDQI
jgi:hypothetical protein